MRSTREEIVPSSGNERELHNCTIIVHFFYPASFIITYCVAKWDIAQEMGLGSKLQLPVRPIQPINPFPVDIPFGHAVDGLIRLGNAMARQWCIGAL